MTAEIFGKTQEPLGTYIRRYALVIRATIVSGAFGFLVIAFGKLILSYSHFWSEVVVEGGKVIVVTSVIGLIFEFLMHERFVQRVREQVGSIEHEVKHLEASLEHLQKTVAITSGAIESGLSAVYSDRDQALKDIAKLLERPKRGQELLLLGISLGDFLCPHGRLYGRIAEALQGGVNVKALLVDLDSDAAKTRAQTEESNDKTPKFGSDGWVAWYQRTKCYDELKTATDEARRYILRYAGQAASDGAAVGKFECRVYGLTPLCFLGTVEGTMFLESYHYAGRGGEAPIMKISEAVRGSGRGSRLFDIYTEHFSRLWNLAKPVTDEPGPNGQST